MPIPLSANCCGVCLCTIWVAAFSLAHATHQTDRLKITQHLFFMIWSGFPSRHMNTSDQKEQSVLSSLFKKKLECTAKQKRRDRQKKTKFSFLTHPGQN